MSADYSVIANQVVPAGSDVIFANSPNPCTQGLIYHRNSAGLFRLANKWFRNNVLHGWRRNANYDVAFHANFAVPEGGTVPDGGISLALVIDGSVDAGSVMTFEPAAADTFGNVGTDVIVTIPCICPCSSVSVRNVSTVPVQIANGILKFD